MDDLVIIAVGAGTSAGWLGVSLALSAFYTVTQLLVVLGKYKARWPLWTARTKAGEVALLILGFFVTVFFLIGLLIGL